MTQSVLPTIPTQAATKQKRQKRSPFGAFVLLTVIVLVGAVIGLLMHERSNSTLPFRGIAPDFTLTTYDGNQLRLSDLRGKIVVLNFWASWCGPCRIEAPELQAAWEEYQGRDDVVFLGIAHDDNEWNSRQFLREYGITYINGADANHRISEIYNIQGIPQTYVIDRDGRVAEYLYARIAYDQLIAFIDPLLDHK